MKAFLLAAGLGTRLRPLTDEMPKCLLPIQGKHLLRIWLDLMGRHGVSEVVVNTHWFAEKVEGFLSADYADYADGERGKRIEWPEVRVFYEEELLGSGGTLWANREWIEAGEAFFILYGDNLTNVDLGKMWRFHQGHGMPFTLGVFRADNPSACGIAEVDGDGVVTGFVEKPEEPKSDLAAAGVYVADQRIFDYFPGNCEQIRPLDLGFYVIPRLVGQMRVYEIGEFLMDIGTADSYHKAQEIYPQITQITQISKSERRTDI